MKTRNVFVGIPQRQLRQDVVPDFASCARRERRNRTLGKAAPQAAQLPVLGPELMPPLRDAVRLVDGKKRDWDLLQPAMRVGALQALRRKVQQPVSTFP